MIMKILITGGSGFIGSHLIRELVKTNHEVINIDFNEPQDKLVTWINLDLSIKSDALEKVFAENNFDIIYHLAAQVSVPYSVENPEYDERNNIHATLNVLSLSNKYKVKHFVFSSSAAVYGMPKYLPIDENHSVNPTSPYGISKLAGELYIKTLLTNSETNYTIFRFANVYGNQGEGVVHIFINSILDNKPVTIFGDGKQTRDFIYVKDLISALLLCLDKQTNTVINLSTQKDATLLDLVKILNKATNKLNKINFSPERAGDIKDSLLTNNTAYEVLGWKPKFQLEDGILDILKESTN